ncbi:lachesin-like [Prorops nasuta]|uniref:lachesin-like n=1 Tax=Prorops nasuta TaxID=863751 RepID=UPI0034CE12F4
MWVAWLLLCCVIFQDYNSNLGRAAITSDVARQDASAASPTVLDVPSFSEPMANVTAAIGKEAILSCTITRLGNYKVAWLRAEDQTVLSMGQRTVTHSSRFQVSVENAKTKNQTRSREEEEAEEFTWRLHIKSLREADRGCYMCQLNTGPMLSQLGCVDVLVPPDILSSGTSDGEVSVHEGENATLSCKASGRPAPTMIWRREKNTAILMRDQYDHLKEVNGLSGEKLELGKVDRKQMGAYLCIARNEVPPAVSKRVYLRVNFAPSVKVPNELLGSPLDTNVTLVCFIEAYPKTINLWSRKGQVIMSGGRYEIDERPNPGEEWKTTIELKIERLEKRDLGEYTCSASSSMGKAETTLSIHEIERATLPTRATSVNWRKSNRGKSKSAQATALNRVYHQVSTPAMQKSTLRLGYSKYATTTTTTVEPRLPLYNNKNDYKEKKNLVVRSLAIRNAVYTVKTKFIITVLLLSFNIR